jgi:hypothetical protein
MFMFVYGAHACPYLAGKMKVVNGYAHGRHLLNSGFQKSKDYNPRVIDWNAVISGCNATFRYEKRMANFYIRAAAHDAFTVHDKYGGADGSVALSVDEMLRSENIHDNFAYMVSVNVKAMAKRFKASYADIIAVCGAVATQYLGGPNIFLKDDLPFYVGRLDSKKPNYANQLADARFNTEELYNFIKSKDMTLKDIVALLGSHSIIDAQGCEQDNGTYCDPFAETCDNIDMFSWSNKYFKDLCGTQTVIFDALQQKSFPTGNDILQFRFNQELCMFTNPKSREARLEFMIENLELMFPDVEYVDVEPTVNVAMIGELPKPWVYTKNDAYMGMACQGFLQPTDYNEEIKKYMLKFADSRKVWDKAYAHAYKKMINLGATWSKYKMQVYGWECNSGYVSPFTWVDCTYCNARNPEEYICPSSCKCKTAFNNTDVFHK